MRRRAGSWSGRDASAGSPRRRLTWATPGLASGEPIDRSVDVPTRDRPSARAPASSAVTAARPIPGRTIGRARARPRSVDRTTVTATGPLRSTGTASTLAASLTTGPADGAEPRPRPSSGGTSAPQLAIGGCSTVVRERAGLGTARPPRAPLLGATRTVEGRTRGSSPRPARPRRSTGSTRRSAAVAPLVLIRRTTAGSAGASPAADAPGRSRRRSTGGAGTTRAAAPSRRPTAGTHHPASRSGRTARATLTRTATTLGAPRTRGEGAPRVTSARSSRAAPRRPWRTAARARRRTACSTSRRTVRRAISAPPTAGRAASPLVAATAVAVHQVLPPRFKGTSSHPVQPQTRAGWAVVQPQIDGIPKRVHTTARR